jgi:hemoglobin
VAQARLDISDHSDVACLVNVFYDRVCADDMLGPIFNDIAYVDWPTRFPSGNRSSLVQRRSKVAYRGALNTRAAHLTSGGFARSIALFHTTMDDLFAGVTADHAKPSALRIALPSRTPEVCPVDRRVAQNRRRARSSVDHSVGHTVARFDDPVARLPCGGAVEHEGVGRSNAACRRPSNLSTRQACRANAGIRSRRANGVPVGEWLHTTASDLSRMEGAERIVGGCQAWAPQHQHCFGRSARLDEAELLTIASMATASPSHSVSRMLLGKFLLLDQFLARPYHLTCPVAVHRIVESDPVAGDPADPGGIRVMPGLTLTLPQATRLCAMNADQTDRLLSELVDRRFLMRDMKGVCGRRGCQRFLIR